MVVAGSPSQHILWLWRHTILREITQVYFQGLKIKWLQLHHLSTYDDFSQKGIQVMKAFMFCFVPTSVLLTEYFDTHLVSFCLCWNVRVSPRVCVCFCLHRCIFMCSVWCHLFGLTRCLCECVWSRPPRVVTAPRRFIFTCMTLLRPSCRSPWGLWLSLFCECQVVL